MTKYYTADLELRVLPARAFADADAAASSEWDAAVAGAEAAILLLDATAPLEAVTGDAEGATRAPLAVASAWAERLSGSAGTLLCVSSKCDVAGGSVPGAAERPAPASYGTDGRAAAGSADDSVSNPVQRAAAPPQPAAHRAHIARVAAWALDAGFEHVEAACTEPLVGAAARDKCGVPRVVEALEATMWSSLEPRRAGEGGGNAEGAAATGAGVGASASAEEDTAGAGSGAATAGSEMAASGTSGAPQERGPESAAAALTAALGAAADGEDGGIDVADLMAQMRAVRDAAVGGGLSDEARREAAAAVAMRFLALLETGEEGEEEGEGE